VIAYRAMLDVPRELVGHLAGLLRAERKRRAGWDQESARCRRAFRRISGVCRLRAQVCSRGKRAAAVAQIREIRLVDDLDGEAADETVEFGITAAGGRRGDGAADHQ
jgi:hypothetical protein